MKTLGNIYFQIICSNEISKIFQTEKKKNPEQHKLQIQYNYQTG